MNCMAIVQRGEALLVDCGVTFDDRGLGVDVVHPDFSPLDRMDVRVAGVAVTHGHEDHIGALPYLLKRHDVPVYGPPYALGLVREPTGPRLEGIAPSNVYRAGDGTHMVIAANKDTLFRRLCEAMGRPEMADDPRYRDHQARGVHQDELDAEIAAWAAQHTGEEIDQLLARSGVVCGPVYTIADVFADPQVQARDMLVEHDDPEIGTFRGPGITPRFSATPGAVRWSGPWEPGAQNAEVFGDLLARDEETLAGLRERGVI